MLISSTNIAPSPGGRGLGGGGAELLQLRLKKVEAVEEKVYIKIILNDIGEIEGYLWAL